jgi:glycosyltransferase involved in cell wall biosynthesis
MPRVLVLTTEPLPLPGLPATGAGLRAWGLAQGLRAAGLEVTLLMPADAAATFAPQSAEGEARSAEIIHSINPKSAIRNPHSAFHIPHSAFPWVGTFRRAALPEAVRAHAPDVIVLQHWGLARDLGEVAVPLAIDLAGPHLLERRLWGSPDPEADLGEKLDALRRADFLTASGERQRLYFLPYLGLAGWDLARPGLLPVIPFSMQPAPAPSPPRGDRLVYGGFFLPWQDPTLVLGAALAALDRAGRGELLFIGGAHPRVDVARGRFDALLERLARHPRVRLLEPMSFDRYQALLAEGGVALDLMAPNLERELAYTTRTVVYLATGLPVIHDDYSELGELIAAAGAGWTFDPTDPATPEALTGLITDLLTNALDPAPQARAAHALAARELDWTRTIAPLAGFCRAPFFREGKTAARLAFEEKDRHLRRLQADLEQARAALATLRGKRWVRWGLALTSGRAFWRLPAALLAALAAAALLPVFFANDQLAKFSRQK